MDGVSKRIIALTGLKGSGKDTTADYIIKNYPNWEKDSFAAVLKDITSVLFGWDRKMLAGETVEDRAKREEKDEYWSKKFGRDITPRNMLQFLGTDVLRIHLHEDIWVNALERKILNTDKNIIITDCRFKNEIDMLRQLGGLVIRVEREPLPDWFRRCEEIGKYQLEGGLLDLYWDIDELQKVHRSEWDWIGYDNPEYILNSVSGDFDGLYKQIDKIMEKING